jgi:hypothetical protein
MKIYTEPTEWEPRLLELAGRRYDEAIISTYNLYVGVSESGEIKPDERTANVQTLLGNLNEKKKTTILVGLPYYSPCCNWKDGPCQPCLKQRASLLGRVTGAEQAYKDIKWHYTYEWHLKAYLFRHGPIWKGLFGGVNLSASNWNDALIEVIGGGAEKLANTIKGKVNTSPLISKEELTANGYRKRN